MNHFAQLMLCLTLGCTGSSPDRSLPFDPRPVMGSIREDTAEIARILGDRRSKDAVEPARRLAEIRLGEGWLLPEEFQELEQGFRNAAQALADTLDRKDRLDRPTRSDRRHNGVLFKRLLERCDDCHRRYRPGGISGR